MNTGDLVAEQFRKRSATYFAVLILTLTVYFISYLALTAVLRDDDKIVTFMIILNVINDLIILAALILYTYTIFLLKNSIAKCASFQFQTTGTYVIIGIYVMTFLTQVIYLTTYAISDYSIVVEIFLHKVSNMIECFTVFIMLRSLGSGLKLIPHKLIDGGI